MAYGFENATTSQANTAYGLAGAANVAPKRDTMQSIIENFDPLLNRLDVIMGRASTCADRILGSHPKDPGVAEKQPEPNHLIWAAQARRDRLQRIVDVMEEEIGRIEGGLA